MTEPQTVVGGRYELRRKIAEGGMGSVHEAIHLLSRRVVALKLLAPDVNRDEAKHQRFLREVAAPAQIGHDGIVEVIDAGYDDKLKSLYVAMELLDGETLHDRLAKLQPATNAEHREQLLRIFEELLEPLAAAHAKGIVHRDLKPENVFLHRRRDGKEVVKVLDFGIARDLDGGAQSVTRTGIAMGTPHYMAPEQAMNARDASFPADIWSLGAMLYEALSGQVPFPGDTIGEIIAAAVTTPHRPVTAIAANVPPPIVQLVDRCLAKRPEDRPRDAGVLLEEFRRARGRDASREVATRAIEGQGVAPTVALDSPVGAGTLPSTSLPSAVPSFASASAVPSAATPAPFVGVPPEAPKTSSRLWLYLGVGALVVVLGGGCCGLASLLGLGALGMSSGDSTREGPGGGTQPSVGASAGAGQVRTVTGTLSQGDLRLRSGEFQDRYVESFPPGAHVRVRAFSSDFDTYLIVIPPQGDQIDNDDADGQNARVEIASALAGEYTIAVTSFAPGETGNYALEITVW